MELKDYLLENYSSTYDYCARLQRSGLRDFPPAILTCAITGANQGKEANPNLPESIDEQVEQTYEAYKAGASIVHIHCRDPKNPANMSFNPDDYKKVNRRIREVCPDLIINNTMACGRMATPDGLSPRFMASLTARPEIGSVDVTNYAFKMRLPARKGSLSGRDQEIMRDMNYLMTPEDAVAAVTDFKEYGIKPEFELFDVGDIFYVNHLMRGGFLDQGPHLVQFVSTAWANLPTLEYMLNIVRSVPKNCILGIIAIGPVQFPLLAQALTLGLHVRVGMEDNVYIKRGQLAKNNAELVQKIVRIATELDRPIATPAQARKMLGLGEPRQY